MAFTGNTETLRMKKAFEHYYLLGDERNYREVAKEFGVSAASIANWASAFDWQERIKIREKKIAKLLSQDVEKEVLLSKKQLRRIVREAVKRFVKKMLAGGVEIRDMADFERLVKLDLLLCGELDGGEHVVTVKIEDARQKLEGRIDSIAERYREERITSDLN